MPFFIVNDDITRMQVDAIVNPANPTLLGGGGLDGEIHKAAGERLLKKCKALKGCKTGEAKLTKGYDLPAKYIIHTVGPIWQGGCAGEEKALRICYENVLLLAERKRFKTVAVPIISAGAYGYPPEPAKDVARDEILKFLRQSEMTVYLVLRQKLKPENNRLYSQIEYYMMKNGISSTSDIPSPVLGILSPSPRKVNNAPDDRKLCDEGISPILHSENDKPRIYSSESTVECACESYDDFPDVQSIFDEGPDEGVLPSCKSKDDTKNTVSPSVSRHNGSTFTNASIPPKKAMSPISLEEKLKMLDESFSEMLLRKIDEAGMTDSECYKKANIDRKLFSKIRSDKNYKPSKPTVLAFAIALEMNIEDTNDFLSRAGFALSRASKFDMIIEFFITNGNYNIFEINDALYEFDQNLLGAS